MIEFSKAIHCATQRWCHARGRIELERPKVAAIVNLTPDSFFDGGQWGSDSDAMSRLSEQILNWSRDGVALIDIGAESTRPGSKPIGPQNEIDRLEACLRLLKNDPLTAMIPLSVDTQRAEVARFALELGVEIINDVSGLADPKMAAVVAEFGAGLIIGHMRGSPVSMQKQIGFSDLLSEVNEELCRSFTRAREAGVAAENIVIDAGIGFGKTTEQCVSLVAASRHFAREIGRPVMVGASRKSFLGELSKKPVEKRLAASLALGVIAAIQGASLLRVHDVEETLDSLRVLEAFTLNHNCSGQVQGCER